MKNAAYTLVAAPVFVASLILPVQAREPMKVAVDSRQKAVDTHVKIEKGDIIEVIDITGSIAVSKNAPGVSYAGNQNIKPSTDYYAFAKATPHSLVAYVGSPGHHYQVRKNIFTEAVASGNLFFAFNDGSQHYHDNSGEFQVTYRVIKKEKICSPSSNAKLNIAWTNKTGVPVRVNWINHACVEEPSARLIAPDAAFTGQTYVGHLFKVRDEKGTDHGLITVETTSTKVNIVK